MMTSLMTSLGLKVGQHFEPVKGQIIRSPDHKIGLYAPLMCYHNSGEHQHRNRNIEM